MTRFICECLSNVDSQCVHFTKKKKQISIRNKEPNALKAFYRINRIVISTMQNTVNKRLTTAIPLPPALIY